MKKFLSIIMVITLLGVLAACGSKEASTSAEQEPKPSATPKESEKPKEKEMSAEEQLALEYINVYNNGKDVEAKKKFVEEKVHSDTKQLFSLGAQSTNKSKAIENPKTEGSKDYEHGGKKGKLVLVKGKKPDGKDTELIVHIVDGKVGYVYGPDGKEEKTKNAYAELRKKFN
ncbi:hypothetical protein ERIC1_1c11810 [Paenibacillus larvae subsp. larvae DSM 25719]|nr:hypothetical protein ERIC1_1c11810 [Paenibacillus larvae subsp. larvae DSM 25719]